MRDSVNTVLVVDLDGTLLKSDMLYESFWSALGRNWLSLVFSVAALVRGKAALKSYLSSEADVDATSLPYDEAVIEYVRAHRAQGGRTALVTASNQVFAMASQSIYRFLTRCMGRTRRIISKAKIKRVSLLNALVTWAFAIWETQLPICQFGKWRPRL